ncbi:MAG TPA: hypothetical protein V6D21_18130, partial [Candidatus Obscuribacterales bacterium]
MKKTIYCESIDTALRDVSEKCDEETIHKLHDVLPHLINFMGEEKKPYEFINTALLKVENIESAN